MDELFLYQLFLNILKKSTVIEGRFHVSKGYGNDLNANNFDEVIKDALSTITTARKYPVAILFPPVEAIGDYNKGWSSFKLKMFFVTTSFYDGFGDIKAINNFNNTSDHPITYDWKDMRECAGNFRVIFDKLTRNRSLLGIIRNGQKGNDIVERFSLSNNDRISGVSISFEVELFMPCSLTDYSDNDISLIEIPSQNIHPLYKP